MATGRPRFGELLRQTREQANQTAEVMSILLSMDPANYLAMEAGLRYPDDDTLRRLCVMMEWNYLETQRLLRNEQAAPRLAPPTGAEPLPARTLYGGLEPAAPPAAARVESLGARLKEVRQATGQSTEILAAMLNLAPEQYLQLEGGEAPSDELLRRISMIYNWNFYELQSMLRSEQARELQPRRLGNPFPGASARAEQARALLRDLEGALAGLPDAKLEVLMAQLELIHGAIAQRKVRAEPPAKEIAEPGPRRRGHAAPSQPVAPLSNRKLFS